MNYHATEPNAVIFRVEDDDDGIPVFARIPLIDGKLAETGALFSVHEDDDYNEMGFNQLSFVQTMDGGAIDLARFELTHEDGPAVLYEMIPSLQDAIPALLADYYSFPPATLQ